MKGQESISFMIIVVGALVLFLIITSVILSKWDSSREIQTLLEYRSENEKLATLINLFIHFETLIKKFA